MLPKPCEPCGAHGVPLRPAAAHLGSAQTTGCGGIARPATRSAAHRDRDFAHPSRRTAVINFPPCHTWAPAPGRLRHHVHFAPPGLQGSLAQGGTALESTRRRGGFDIAWKISAYTPRRACVLTPRTHMRHRGKLCDRMPTLV